MERDYIMRDFHTLKDEERKEYQRKFGRFNDFPPNWKPCKPAEFWGQFMTYSSDVEEFRQMMYPEEILNNMPPNSYGQITVQNARLWTYQDGTGLAMVQNYDYKKAHDRAPLLYKFAVCEHEYVGVPEKSYMCYHVSRCMKCGIERAIDSSD
jgi:hypothetical protein